MAGIPLLHGCAGTAEPAKGSSKKNSFLAVTSLKTGTFTADGRYQLSRQERAQSCKRIKGKMNIRIVQLKRTGILRSSSTLARKFSSVFGGNNHGLDGKTYRRRERAILVAYNRLLAKKKCPTMDLDKELGATAFPATTGSQKIGVRPQTR